MDTKEEILDSLDEILVWVENIRQTGYLELKDAADEIESQVESIKDMV